ncbi:ring-cleaving dioxygenase [Xanthobacteraceae bacterium A53D]
MTKLDLTLTGFHHLTAVSADASYNHKFYTDTLGMRLVKKTVNQDDTSAYHLFYADGEGNPGTDITFFDWPVGRERRGNHTVSRTGLRVKDEAALAYWQERLKALNVAHGEIVLRDNRPTLDFEDAEGQRLSLVADGGQGPGVPWAKSPVPADVQVRGLGPITMSVADLKGTDAVLTQLLNMRQVRSFTDQPDVTTHVYEMGEGGPAAELHVRVDPKSGSARPGAGGVHHVAFRVPTFEDYEAWNARIRELGVPSSGPVDRFYFKSLYFREPGGVLFELATDAPGFSADEPQASLGERLSLPPFLEGQRAAIEAGLKPL